jgi:hypothetical protein
VKSIGRTILQFVIILTFGSSMAWAQSSRTWVSGLGDDNNPCSRTLPCHTFAAALTKTADGGEIDALDSSGYGAVTINKSITIDGGGTLAGILNSGVVGVTINAPTSSLVTLRNLSINGAMTGVAGVRITAGGRVALENVAINDDASGFGLEIAAPVSVSLDRCSMSNTFNAGIYSHPSGPARLSVSRSFFDSTATALFLQSNTTASVFDSTLVHNGLGVYIADGTSSAHVHNSTVSENDMGVNVAGPVTFFGSQVTGNTLAFTVNAGGEVRTHGNNAIVGNASLGATPVSVGLQ